MLFSYQEWWESYLFLCGLWVGLNEWFLCVHGIRGTEGKLNIVELTDCE